MNSRNQSLDVLRGIAILLVLGRHAPYVEHSRLRPWFIVGWSGVDLFFVLSGFLISGLLFSEFNRTGKINVKRFWLRRAFKIYPPFYALVIVLAVVSLFRTGTIPAALIGDVLFLQNYWHHVIDHGWSLAIEEHFYFLLPVLLFALARQHKGSDPFRFIPSVSIALTVLCLALRVHTSHSATSWEEVAHPTHLRIDALFLGVTLGYYSHFHSLRLPGLGLVAGVMLVVLGTMFGIESGFTATVGLIFVPVGYACILIWSVNHRLRGLGLIAGLGRYSYSVYLWHWPITVLCKQFIGESRFSMAVYLLSSLVVGIVMAKLIELPSLRLRDKLFAPVPARATMLPDHSAYLLLR